MAYEGSHTQGVEASDAQNPRKRHRGRRVFWLVIELVCAFVIVCCVGVISEEVNKYVVADSEFKEVVEETGRDVEAVNKYTGSGDAVGWIRVEDTKIDYPVMYTPGDPEYYLHRNVKKKYSFPGTPFLGEGSNPEDPATNSMIVYAHHMNDGSMFGQLEKFESKSFAEEHIIYYTDSSGEHDYRVIAAWHEDISGGNYYRYWDNVGALDETAYTTFLADIAARTDYTTSTSASYGDKLLMLSTCSYGTSEERYVVVAAEK